MADFNRDKCAQRNRIAARRDGVNAAPVHFFRTAGELAPAERLVYSEGALPATEEEALARINALLPANAPPLHADQIYLHYCEAASNRFIGNLDPRPMFLGDTTLRNMAQDAAGGVAFMNSHRTGGLSHPAQLPMGKTFAGRYEELADGTKRTVIGFYMLRGVAPNGPEGPTTDAMHVSILGGTLFDTSVGLGSTGEKVCDLCGHALQATDEDGRYLCPHVPGTTRRMTTVEQEAQRARGVEKGFATYTLHHAHMNEFSGVYAGAVPGAGFNKALALARELTPAERLQIRAAYATLLRKGDLPMDWDELIAPLTRAFEQALRLVGLGRAAELELAPAVTGVAAATLAEVSTTLTVPPPVSTAREQELAAQLATREQELAQERTARQEAEAAQRQKDATTFADGLVQTGRILPAARPAVLAGYAQALADDAGHQTTVAYHDALGVAQTGTRAQAWQAAFNAAPAQHFGDHIPAQTLTLPAGNPPPDAKARQTELLALTALGQAILASAPQEK